VVVEAGEGRVALLVEEVLGCQEIVVQPLEEPLRELRCYSGAGLTDEGVLVLVVDPRHLPLAD
jgi:two-component system chemotaxis sensor kinase CheA